MVFMTLTWNLPNSDLRRRITKVTRYFFIPTGLWQGWGMFATPIPNGYAIRIGKLYPSGQIEYERQHVVQGVGYRRDVMRGFYLNIMGDTQGKFIDPMLKTYCDK